MRSEKASRLTPTQRARRADILRAATTVINRDGYAAASIDAIAREAATNKSTVLYHFKSKRALLQALVAQLYEDGAVMMAKSMAPAASYREQLQAYITSNLAFIAANAKRVVAILEIERNLGRLLFDASTDLRANEAPAAKLSELLYKGQQAQEFTAFNPFVTASVIRAVIDNAAFYVASHPEADMELTIREVVALFDRATHKPRADKEDTSEN